MIFPFPSNLNPKPKKIDWLWIFFFFSFFFFFCSWNLYFFLSSWVTILFSTFKSLKLLLLNLLVHKCECLHSCLTQEQLFAFDSRVFNGSTQVLNCFISLPLLSQLTILFSWDAHLVHSSWVLSEFNGLMPDFSFHSLSYLLLLLLLAFQRR